MKKNECISSTEINYDQSLNEVKVVHQLDNVAANRCCIQCLSIICEMKLLQQDQN